METYRSELAEQLPVPTSDAETRGREIVCPECGSPYVLDLDDEVRYFECGTETTQKPVNRVWQSWKCKVEVRDQSINELEEMIEGLGEQVTLLTAEVSQLKAKTMTYDGGASGETGPRQWAAPGITTGK